MNNYKTTQKEQILLMLQEEPRTSHCIMKENIFFNEIVQVNRRLNDLLRDGLIYYTQYVKYVNLHGKIYTYQYYALTPKKDVKKRQLEYLEERKEKIAKQLEDVSKLINDIKNAE